MNAVLSSFRLPVVALAASLALPALADELPSFKAVACDGVFEPAVIEVPAGKRFQLEISNQGKLIAR